ncbi:S-methyl-5-thioribose-1-phosphate isomerase/adenine phosphoribosyltransferase [Kitasatospora sp. MAP12-15]|uniref:S-methyl-5-thioribose-1-phosphate isomerase n=1 Tax=unclassified Kitasatospora TaxID=2633591 RepID=UPI002474C7F3|nr:S-methyl-5-thioribose-1-phosphate isomerase [Kitasatospora sp. MAP12-44]MDH6109373.1 S-methyl-5-thioribose-1-phosphate isomerase/adenine phosphoribosyltransferase [Kitasatospora sp. MAP12-44]
MRYSISWDDGEIHAVDQRLLPRREQLIKITTVDGVIDAIRTLAVRGAPAIGIAGAFGVALSARRHRDLLGGWDEHALAAVRRDAARIAATRPTAVNLSWAVAKVVGRLPDGPEAALAEARSILAADALANIAAATRAADLVAARGPDRPLRVLTHCNTGRFATAAGGTALGAIIELAARGRVEQVLVGETRPLLQGSRLTAKELADAGIPYRICVDSAAAAAMAGGLVDVVLVGADRIARSGDVANKIGTYALAIAAARHRIPFVVVATESTVDEQLADGSGIVVEERGAEEVTSVAGTAVAPEGAAVYNPAFDVTPAELITAVVTDRRVLGPVRAVLPGQGPGAVRAEEPDALAERIAAHTRLVEDFPIPGVGFLDLAPVYTQPWLMDRLVAAVLARFGGEFDQVAGIEARGFLLGTAVARAAGCGLVAVRKPGKLPPPVIGVDYALEYGKDTLELSADALGAGARVLVVDDVLATGGTAAAAVRLVERTGAAVVGCAVVAELAELGGRLRLNVPVFAARTVLGE